MGGHILKLLLETYTDPDGYAAVLGGILSDLIKTAPDVVKCE